MVLQIQSFFWKFFKNCKFLYSYWIFSQICFFYLKVQSFRLIMENNFIQMVAFAGLHDRSNLWAHYPLCAAVFYQWLHEHCPLKYQFSLAYRHNTYLWRQPTNNTSNRWPNDISSTADNAIFKNSAHNIDCRFGCVDVAPSCWNQMLPISFSSIFVNKNSFNMAR